MGPTQISGLPAHVLLVHAVVVLVPLTAAVLVACAIWPSLLRRTGVFLPLLALVTLGCVPLTTHAGEWLEKHTASTPLLRKHTELGDSLLPWTVALFALSTALWWWHRHSIADTSGTPGAGTATSGATTDGRTTGATAAAGIRTDTGTAALALPLRIAAVVLCAAVSAGSVVQVYRIGESGAKAAWTGNFSQQPVRGHGG